MFAQVIQRECDLLVCSRVTTGKLIQFVLSEGFMWDWDRCWELH